MSYGKTLKKIRKEKNIETLDAVDKSSAMDSSNYHKYEQGKGNPTLTKILELAVAIGVNPKELLDFDFEVNKEELK